MYIICGTHCDHKKVKDYKSLPCLTTPVNFKRVHNILAQLRPPNSLDHYSSRLTCGAYSGSIAHAFTIHLKACLVEEWLMFHQVIDWAIKQWRPRLMSCVWGGGHFKGFINKVLYKFVCLLLLYFEHQHKLDCLPLIIYKTIKVLCWTLYIFSDVFTCRCMLIKLTLSVVL